MKKLQAIIFDVDGTLADTEEHHRQAFNLAFDNSELGWFWTREHYIELLRISGGFERMRAYAASLSPRFPSGDRSDRFFRELHDIKSKHYAARIERGEVALRTGVKRLLDDAEAAGIRLAIATSSRRSNVDALLNVNLGANWADRFEVIASSNEVDAKKPSPAVYRYVIEAMQLDADRCVAIEDTCNGFHAARAAGLHTLVTPHAMTMEDDFSNADLVVDSLGDVGRPARTLCGSVGERNVVDVAALQQMVSGGETVTPCASARARELECEAA